MLNQAGAKIFLADQRGCTQADHYRCFHTFNFKGYVNEHKEPIASLLTLNDEALKAGSTITHTSQQSCMTLILPLIGSCICTIRKSQTFHVDVGQIFTCFLEKEDIIEITNPYKKENISYLFLQVESPKMESEIIEFNIDENINMLVKLKASPVCHLYLGKYEGRKEDLVLPTFPCVSFFTFAIGGAFEVNNRLLHPRDGLALWDTNGVEFEALSNEAIILVIELNSPSKM